MTFPLLFFLNICHIDKKGTMSASVVMKFVSPFTQNVCETVSLFAKCCVCKSYLLRAKSD